MADEVEVPAAVQMAVAGLQHSLTETMAVAAAEGNGVVVRWTRSSTVPEMKVEMFISPDLEADEVRYEHIPEVSEPA